MTSRRTAATIGLASVLVTSGLIALGTTGTANAAATAPWTDAQSAGSITFYDAAGTAITHGSTTGGAFFAYAVGSAVPRSGDTQAAVVLASPKPGSQSNTWIRDQITGFGSFPVTGAPSSIGSLDASHPVVAGGASDLSLDAYVTEAPNDAAHAGSASYVDLYQVRLVTADTAGAQASTYDTATIAVDPTAHTWSLYSGSAAGAQATTLTGNRRSAIGYGRSTTASTVLTDSVTGKKVGGQTVVLYGRSGKAFVKVATARTGSTGAASVKVSPRATTTYQWRFAGTSTLKASTGASWTVTVRQSVAISVRSAAGRPGRVVRVFGTVAPATKGEVVHLQHRVGKAFKAAGTVRLRLQKLPSGRRAVGYVFRIKAPHKGSAVYRVTSSATRSTAAGTSRAVTVKA